MITAVIFDLDGLIVDTEIIESQAFEKLIKENGKVPEFNADGLVQEIGGAGLEAYYSNIKQKYDLPGSLLEIQAQKRAFFEQLIRDGKIKPYKGFFELLKILKTNHIRTALASNRPIHHIHLILNELKILKFFEIIVGPEKKIKHKPEPDIYLETAKRLKLRPENCLALEDTTKGITSAKAAGMKVIAVPNVYTKDHNFSNADRIVTSLKEINLNTIRSLEIN